MSKYILLLLITSNLLAEPQLEKYWYHGHYYIVFNEYCYVHDPDCDCYYDPEDLIIDDD